MKTAIIYRSFLGTTRHYAKWLAEDIGSEVMTFSQASADKPAGFDTIIIMSGTYCSWMPLVSFLKKHWDNIKDKKVAVVAVGIVMGEDPGNKISYERIPEEIRAKIKYFKIPGRMGNNPKANKMPVVRQNLKPVIDFVNEQIA
jgi:menaquinone-dependent protoporphyrinogen IX oxidase